MTLPAPGPAVSERLGRRHKTVAERSAQIVRILRRWLPQKPIRLTGDGAYSVLELGLVCRGADMALVAPLVLDARLFAPAPKRTAHICGRPRAVGKRLKTLSAINAAPDTVWQPMRIRWYDRRWRKLEVVSGTALWYRFGRAPLPVRWLLVRDPKDRCDTRAFFSTRTQDTPQAILQTFIQRWTIEVTFQEARAHLGLQTQRQWSDKAIGCSTPRLFSLYSRVALFANALYPNGHIPVAATAWYHKTEPTFADVLAAVRRQLWGGFDFPTADKPGLLVIPKALMQRLAYSVCYAH